jgi:hypothetical protein
LAMAAKEFMQKAKKILQRKYKKQLKKLKV